MQPEDKRGSGIDPKSGVFLVTLGLVGIAVIVIGALISIIGETYLVDKFVPFGKASAVYLTNASAALGAAIFGSAISLLLARYFEPSELRHLIDLIATSQACPLTRDESAVEPFRLRYHGYLRSHSATGEPIWRYRVFDFSRSRTPGHLHGVVNVPLPEGGSKDFVYDGFVCGEHILLVGNAVAGAEPCVIHVFPNGCLGNTRYIAGLCFVLTFSGKQLVAPTILSQDRLVPRRDAGELSADDGVALMNRWKKGFYGDTFNGNVFNVE